MVRSVLFSFIMLFAFTAAHAQNEIVEDLYEWKTMEEAQKLADENSKKVVVYANASWCTYCKKMESEVLTSETVQQTTADNFYPVWVDIESDEKMVFRGEEITQIQFAQAMRITGTPTFVFLGPDGEIIAGQPGFIPEEMYLQMLNFIGSDAYLKQSFGEFTGNESQE